MGAELSHAVAAIRSHWKGEAAVGLILGTGLGGLIEGLRVDAEIPYGKIHFPRSTAMAHKGALLCGELAGVNIITMAGRCHLYEGYSLADIQLPIQVLHALGVRALLLTNAAGGLNPRFEPGDVMVIEDHLNLMGFAVCPSGLTVREDGAAGEEEGEKRGRSDGAPVGFSPPLRYSPSPRLSASPYDSALRETALATARLHNFPCRRGVYVGVKGPNYETRAEYRAFRGLGGDAVGMSTIPEVLAAATLGMKVLGLSTITNVAHPDSPQVVTSEEVVEVAGIAQPKLRQIIQGILEFFPW